MTAGDVFFSDDKCPDSSIVLYCEYNSLRNELNIWPCKDGTGCIKNVLRCDGFAQCDDKSDEKNCNGTVFLRFPMFKNEFV